MARPTVGFAQVDTDRHPKDSVADDEADRRTDAHAVDATDSQPDGRAGLQRATAEWNDSAAVTTSHPPTVDAA